MRKYPLFLLLISLGALGKAGDGFYGLNLSYTNKMYFGIEPSSDQWIWRFEEPQALASTCEVGLTNGDGAFAGQSGIAMCAAGNVGYQQGYPLVDSYVISSSQYGPKPGACTIILELQYPTNGTGATNYKGTFRADFTPQSMSLVSAEQQRIRWQRSVPDCAGALSTMGVDWAYWLPGRFHSSTHVTSSSMPDNQILHYNVYVNGAILGGYHPIKITAVPESVPEPAFCSFYVDPSIDHGAIGRDSLTSSASTTLTYACTKSTTMNFSLGRGTYVDLPLGGGITSHLCISLNSVCVTNNVNGYVISGDTGSIQIVSSLTGDTWEPGAYSASTVFVVTYN